MSPLLALDREAITRACEHHGVARLRLFGSALTDRFDPSHSDIDLLVDYKPDAERTFQAFFSLRSDLESSVGAPVDLVDAEQLRNPYIARTVLSTAQELYAA